MPSIISGPTALGYSGGSFDVNGNRTVKESWAVSFDSGDSANFYNAAFAAGIPDYGVVDSLTGLVVIEKGAEREPGDDSGANWRPFVVYGNNATLSTQVTPWTRKDQIEFADVRYERVMEYDFSTSGPGGAARPVRNTAGDQFQTPLQRTLINPLLRIHRARRQADFDPFDAIVQQQTLNQDSFTIKRLAGDKTIAAEEALLHTIRPRDKVWYASGTKYYEIIIEIELKAQVDLKTVRIRNYGFRELAVIDGTQWHVRVTDRVVDPADPTKFLMAAGKPVLVPSSQPALLDDLGHRVPSDDLTDTAFDPALYDQEFTRYPTTDWSGWIA